MIKKIIIIALSILLPILAGVGVVTYGLSVRYSPENNTEVSSKFIREINKGVITCEGRIKNYRMMENYYYSTEPLLKKDYLNDDGKRVFTLEIYRNLCAYQPNSQTPQTWKCLFEVFLYNVDYELMKDYFYLDDMRVLDDAGNPTFSIKFIPTNGKESFTLTLSNRSNVMIPDYDSNPEYADVSTKTRNYLQSVVTREYEKTATFDTFSSDANFEINAYYTITNEDSSTTEIYPKKNYIVTDYLSDFNHKGDEFDIEDFLPGFRQPSVKDTYKNAGYYKWLFKTYLWWEFLVGAAVIGVITLSFDIFYFDKENKKLEVKKNKKAKK